MRRVWSVDKTGPLLAEKSHRHETRNTEDLCSDNLEALCDNFGDNHARKPSEVDEILPPTSHPRFCQEINHDYEGDLLR